MLFKALLICSGKQLNIRFPGVRLLVYLKFSRIGDTGFTSLKTADRWKPTCDMNQKQYKYETVVLVKEEVTCSFLNLVEQLKLSRAWFGKMGDVRIQCLLENFSTVMEVFIVIFGDTVIQNHCTVTG